MIKKVLTTAIFVLLFIVLSYADFSRDMDLSQATASFLGEEAHDNAGRWVSIAGDINRDGYDDILIGANDNGEGGSKAGQAYLIFGKSAGWAMDTDLSTADASFIGEEASNLAGWFVSGAGDVNGDGYDDFLIGAPGFLDANNHGSAYLIWGKAGGWHMDIDLSTADVALRGTNAGDITGYCASDAGDVNADGYDDFIVGAYGNSENGNQAGKAYLILGKADGWPKDIEISAIASASFLGEAAGDQAGIHVAAAGDVNGDMYDDFLIGAINNDESGIDAGQVYLLLGKKSGWTKDLNLSQADASFLGEEKGDNTGNAMASAGDVNGDGYDDILVAAYYNSENGYHIGQVYLILGKPAGWHIDTPLSESDASFWGEHADDKAGKAVSTTGDLNRDGFDDFLIGAYGNDDGGDFAGQAYLIMGKATGWSRDFPLAEADASFWGENADDRAGRSLSGTGDCNGDGFNDLLIASYACDESGIDAGQVYLWLDESLTVTSPNRGEVWEAGHAHQVTWTSSGSSGKVKIELSRDNGSSWEILFDNTPDDQSEPWTVTEPASNTCLVRITDSDGSPSDQSDGLFKIISGWDITGNIYYGINGDPVDDAVVTIPGTSWFDTTDNHGDYELLELSTGNYVVRPEKENNINHAISAYDAAWILQYDVGRRSFTPCQMMAADVSGDGTVSAYDGAKILQYGVGLINQFPVMSDSTHFWRFVPDDFTLNDNNWRDAPDSIAYSPLNSNIVDDYKAMLYGDVSGNWHPSDRGLLADSFIGAADIRLADMYGSRGDRISLPLYIDSESEIIALNFTLRYDPKVLNAIGASVTPLTNDYLIVHNIKGGQIKVALAGSRAISGSDSVVTLEFEVLQDAKSYLQITEMQLNDGNILANIQAGEFKIGSPVPEEYVLHQNYPNPFNPETAISFSLKDMGKVTLKIYNLQGQLVRTLVDQEKPVGFYSVMWNGSNDQGTRVTSGIYLYTLKINGFEETKKLVFMQ